jgi:hypothetical protein
MPSSVYIAQYHPGKSVALVGHLLFYLIARGERTILQAETLDGGLGYVFDDDGVREFFRHDARIYNDGGPCYLLVNADGTQTYPSVFFQFLQQNYRCDFAEHEVQAGFEKLEEASPSRPIYYATTFMS